ncbi:MAG: AraC family transcriptional regulator [Duganella sp.]
MHAISLPPAADAIDELLLGMRLAGLQYRRSAIGATSGLAFGNPPARAQFHFLARGRLWLHAPDGTSIALQAGDAVLLPRGGPHAVLAAPDLPVGEVPLFELARQANAPAPAPAPDLAGAVIFSCCMELDLGGMQPLIDAMPTVLLTSELMTAAPEAGPLLMAMERESTTMRAGSTGILVRLAEVVAALIVRDWVANGASDATGWVGALHDPRLGRAIFGMHRDPGRNWTVAALAKEAGHSRSVFSQRFSRATGSTPLEYLTGLRMRLAVQQIGRAQQPIATVATQLGYGSLAAFSRAFKRYTGVSPGAMR